MPHCIIEYSQKLESSLDIKALVQCVHSSTLASGLFSEQAIKSRAIAYEHYQTGGSDGPFIHITIRLFDGRTGEQKAALSRAVLDDVIGQMKDVGSVTVEIVDIDKASYSSHPG